MPKSISQYRDLAKRMRLANQQIADRVGLSRATVVAILHDKNRKEKQYYSEDSKRAVLKCIDQEAATLLKEFQKWLGDK